MDRTEQIQKTLSKALELMTDGKLEAARTNILQANAEVMHNRLELDEIIVENLDNPQNGMKMLKAFIHGKE